jgi:hypothetical protein
VISIRDILLLAWREIWSTLRHPAFWFALMGVPVILLVIGVLAMNVDRVDLPFSDDPPVVVMDATGVLSEAVVERLRKRGWNVDPGDVAEVTAVREQVSSGDVWGLILLDDQTLNVGRMTLERVEEPRRRYALEIEDAVLMAVVTASGDAELATLAGAAAEASLVHVRLDDQIDPEKDRLYWLAALTLASGLVMLFPVGLLGAVISQGMRRDRRSGFSTLLVCATRAENALAGQILGGLVLGLVQGVVFGATFAVYTVMTAASSQVSRGAGPMEAVMTVAGGEGVTGLIESGLAQLDLQLSAGDLVVPAITYCLLAVLGVFNYAAWGMAAALGTSSSEEETDAVRQARVLAMMAVIYPAMFLGYLALADPTGWVAAWGQLVPVLFTAVVWGRYLAGVADFWSILLVAGHIGVSVALIRSVARAYVTGETLWELGRRHLRHWRAG